MNGVELKPASLEAIPSTIAQLRASFAAGKTRTLQYREQQLASLDRLLDEREPEIYQAMREDLGRSELETSAVETSVIARELAFTRKRFRAWAKPERVPTPFFLRPGGCRIYREPLGTVLIIGPWNYPLQLVLVPLIGAIAAGNCAVIKPSELAPSASAFLATALPQYLDPECVRVVVGGPAESTALLAERFDHIFYTGSPRVGQIVMEAAAKHLTPVTLELGGKSPCIVDRTADLGVAARRIVWGKFLNAGQTCVAPDYVLVHEAVESALLTRLTATVREFYGEHPRSSPDFARIVNARHHRRLMQLLDSGGEVMAGGDANENERYLSPTILTKVPPDSPVMTEEIFGPILPVLPVKSIDDAIAFVNRREKPLALYVFTDDARVRTRVLESTTSGGASVNYTVLHFALPNLPFGGVGNSGMGAYHGRASFETFSHHKSVFMKTTWPDFRLAYPPLSRIKDRMIRWLL
jgi:aldehyde dehydrogenase (NAD+)